METARPVIDAEGHGLTVSLPPEPLWLNGDLVRLTQVVSNLLTNAADALSSRAKGLSRAEARDVCSNYEVALKILEHDFSAELDVLYKHKRAHR